MKINRQNVGQKLTLGDIKNTHPFQFDNLPGLDPGRVYIKVYPIPTDPNVQFSKLLLGKGVVLVVDLEQGGIRAVAACEPVVLLEYDFTVHGPVPRYLRRP